MDSRLEADRLTDGSWGRDDLSRLVIKLSGIFFQI